MIKKIYTMADFCTCEEFKKINEAFEWAEQWNKEEELAKIKHLETNDKYFISATGEKVDYILIQKKKRCL
jgi:hypothetical protein